MSQFECAVYYNSATELSEIFVGDFATNSIVRHEIDASLDHTQTTLPLAYGVPWIAGDLDFDGELELVVQRGDAGTGGNGYLDIISLSSGSSRGHFVFPGMKVYMYPVACDIDGDPADEIFLTPSTLLTGAARCVIVDYSPVSDSFEVVSDIIAPDGSGGPPAAADFDADGRYEFILGNSAGYDLFEYDGASLSHVGPVGLPYAGYHASCVRPKPGGLPHALVGSSWGDTVGFRYQLLEPVGNNAFNVSWVFQEATGWTGIHPSIGADIDCDGMDEVAMDFYPTFQVWEWDPELLVFVSKCRLESSTYGSLGAWRITDLDQNTIPEFGTVNHLKEFRAFDSECASCLSVSSNPTAWWTMDEDTGTTAIDIWGGNDGVHVDSASATSGKVSNGLSLGGSGRCVQVPATLSLDVGTGDFSVDCWINTSTPTMNPVIGNFDCSTGRGWALWLDGSSNVGFRLANATVSDFRFTDSNSIADGVWHHLALTVDRDVADGIRCYVDGWCIGIADPTFHQGDLSQPGPLWIGRGVSEACDTAYFRGILDEVRVYGTVLDRFEIRSTVSVDILGNCKPPGTVCNCNSQGDIANDDGFYDSVDLAYLIDYVFFAGTQPSIDPKCPHVDRGDVNCDSFDDAVDLAEFIDLVFFSGPYPCNPCACSPYPTGCP